jgi:hypothetical protein
VESEGQTSGCDVGADAGRRIRGLRPPSVDNPEPLETIWIGWRACMGRLSRNAVHFWRAHGQQETAARDDDDDDIDTFKWIYGVESEGRKASASRENVKNIKSELTCSSTKHRPPICRN